MKPLVEDILCFKSKQAVCKSAFLPLQRLHIVGVMCFVHS